MQGLDIINKDYVVGEVLLFVNRVDILARHPEAVSQCPELSSDVIWLEVDDRPTEPVKFWIGENCKQLIDPRWIRSTFGPELADQLVELVPHNRAR